MPHMSTAIANAIIDHAKKNKLPVTPMHLQKLLYFLNGWYMEGTNGEILINEDFLAWQFGPVVPSVYHEFKIYRSLEIRGKAIAPFSGEPWKARLDSFGRKILKQVVPAYGKLTARQLSILTHRPETAWSKTWKNGTGKGHAIPAELILEEFKGYRKRYEHSNSS